VHLDCIPTHCVIPLTQGLTALVDAEDFEELSKYHWYAHLLRGYWYAHTNIGKGSSRRTISMHRFLIKPGPGEIVDHRDRNTLNNVRGNLRRASRSQNKMNAATAFKGVHFRPRRNRWDARITVGEKRIHLGTFLDEFAAAHAYDDAARQFFGVFAKTNFDVEATYGFKVTEVS